MQFKEDAGELSPEDVEELVKRSTSDAEDYDLEKQGVTMTILEMQVSTTSGTISTTRNNQGSVIARLNTRPCDGGPSEDARPEPTDQGKWVLLCLPGQKSHEVHNTCVKAAQCNQDIYERLHKCYYSQICRWLRWLALHKLDTVSFVRVSLAS